MARSFNGTTDKIVTSGLATTATTGWTMAALLKPTNAGTGTQCAFFNGNSAANGFGLFTNLAAIGPTNVFCCLPGATTPVAAAASLTAGAWSHGAAVNTAGSIQCFINGVASGTPSARTVIASTTVNHLGVDSATSFYAGSMADAAIWNIALTATELLALANGARPYTIRPANLKGWWDLDGIQATEPDLSGFANNGTLTGTALASGPPFVPFTPRWPQVNSLPLLGPAAGLGWIINRRNKLGWRPK